MKTHKCQNSNIINVQQEQRKQEERSLAKQQQETSLPLPHALPLAVGLPNIHGAALAGGTRHPQAVTESQGGTCSSDDSCSRRSRYSWVAESTAQRSSLQIWAALCTSQFLRFEKWSCDSSNKCLKKNNRCFSCLSVRPSVLLVPYRRPQQRPKLPFFRWAGRKEARNAKASGSYSPRRGKGHLLHSWSS